MEQLKPHELTVLERSFLAASTACRDQERHAVIRGAIRLRRLRTALSLATVLALVAGVVAWERNRDGERRLAEAASRRVVSVVESMRYADPLTAMRLSVAAWRISPTLEARAALLGAMTQREQDTFTEPGAQASNSQFLSSDGRALFSGSPGRVRVWDLNSHQQTHAVRTGRNEQLLGLSPDGQWLLFREGNRWLLRDLASGALIRLPLTFIGAAVVFGPGAHTLTLESEGRPRVWDLRRRRELPQGETARVLRSSRQPAGERRTVCTSSGVLELWDGRANRRLRTGAWASVARLACGGQRGDLPYSLYPNADTLMVVTETLIRTWNLPSGKEHPPVPRTGPFHVTPDGKFLVTVDDRDISLWRISSSERPVYRYPLNGRRIRELRLDPHRTVIRYIERQSASAPVVRTLYLGNALDSAWRSDAPRDTPAAPYTDAPDNDLLTSVAVSPRGSDRIATGDETGWVTIWDRALKQRFSMFAGTAASARGDQLQPVSVLAYSPDGRLLAVAGGGTVRLWDVASTQPLGDGLLTAGDRVTELTFSRDGETLTVHGAQTPPHVYPIDPGLVTKAVCERSNGGLTAAYWKTNIPEVPYRKTC
ncbi:WD40 repeat domain-containing protein [Streptomyces sp. NPDC059396]|uniref:WD40 repeat domain-containing protein n=1 Tax=Streptomyces sp. NPDC059396 TaxID=3346819 RepID=UPI0036A4F04A